MAKDRLKQFIPRRVWLALRSSELQVRKRFCRIFVGLLHYARDGHEDLITIVWESNAITSERVIEAYAIGMFPLPLHSGKMRWHDPDLRGVLSLTEFHVPKSLRSSLNKREFEIRFDTNFRGVMEACAAPAPGRETTFVSRDLQAVWLELHEMGVAHSVEAYQNGELVGGLYGIAIGGLFSGSSMFHHVDNASRVALVHLAAVLRRNGFVLLDVWWLQPHFTLFGAVEIPREEYKKRLARAIVTPATFRLPEQPFYVDHREFNG